MSRESVLAVMNMFNPAGVSCWCLIDCKNISKLKYLNYKYQNQNLFCQPSIQTEVYKNVSPASFPDAIFYVL